MWMTLWKILSWLSIWRKDRQLSKKTCTRCSIVSLSLKCDASGRHLAKYIYYVYDSLFRICAEGSSYKEPRSSQSSKTPVLDCKFRDMWQIFLLIPLPGRRQKLVYTEHYFAALAAKAQYHKIGRQEQQDWQREQVHGVQNQVGILQVSSCLTLPCVVVHSRPSFRLGCSIWAAGCAGGVSNQQLLLQDEIGGTYRDWGGWGGLGGVAVGDPI